MNCITQVLPDDFEITSVRTFGLTPKPSAMRNASDTATADTPAIRLLHSLATSPLPTAPTWMTLAPMADSAGRASSTSRVSPPTMMASVPSSARGTPPDTGASMNRTPLAFSAAATRRDTAGSIVDMSTQSRPAMTPSAMPFLPRYAVSTWEDDGSIVITRSLRRAASAPDSARVAPRFSAFASAAGTTS